MSKSIVVDHLTKSYRIGRLQHETMLRDALINVVRRPLRRGLRRSKREIILALDDVSFDVNEGDVVGIVGRNGAGKSTLLKVLSRITYPTSGKIDVRGRVASLIEVGTGFHDELTGRENIFLNGSILGMKKREIMSRLDAIIDFAGVAKFIDTPIKRYSSGMRLRLGFAVAAHMEPDVLFVDEVLAVGDADFQKKCLNAMDNLRSGGRTVLFVSHNMGAIESLCPRTIWIDGGRVHMDAPTSEVITTYLATFARAQQPTYDFTDVVDGRAGNGLIRYTGVEFLDPAGNPAQLFRVGEPLRARLNFMAKEEIREPHFIFRVFAETGSLVATVGNWNSGVHISVIPAGSGSVEFTVENLNLLMGRYYISLAIGTTGRIFFDSLEHCFSIDIEESAVHGSSGRGISNRWGVVYLPTEWHLNAVEELK